MMKSQTQSWIQIIGCRLQNRIVHPQQLMKVPTGYKSYKLIDFQVLPVLTLNYPKCCENIGQYLTLGTANVQCKDSRVYTVYIYLYM